MDLQRGLELALEREDDAQAAVDHGIVSDQPPGALEVLDGAFEIVQTRERSGEPKQLRSARVELLEQLERQLLRAELSHSRSRVSP